MTNATPLVHDLSWDAVHERIAMVRRMPVPSAEDVKFLLAVLDLVAPIVTDDEWDFVREA